ncbi:hypothetical protein JCM5353_001790 [Sporobolomyces roseus]
MEGELQDVDLDDAEEVAEILRQREFDAQAGVDGNDEEEDPNTGGRRNKRPRASSEVIGSDDSQDSQDSQGTRTSWDQGGDSDEEPPFQPIDIDEYERRATSEDPDEQLSTFTFDRFEVLNFPSYTGVDEDGDEIDPEIREKYNVLATVNLDSFLAISRVNQPSINASAADTGGITLNPKVFGRKVAFKAHEKLFAAGTIVMGLGDVGNKKWSLVIEPLLSRTMTNKPQSISKLQADYVQLGMAHILSRDPEFHHSGIIIYRSNEAAEENPPSQRSTATSDTPPFHDKTERHNFNNTISLSAAQARRFEKEIVRTWYEIFDPFFRSPKHPEARQMKISFMLQRYGQNVNLNSARDDEYSDDDDSEEAELAHQAAREKILFDQVHIASPFCRVLRLAFATNINLIEKSTGKSVSILVRLRDASNQFPGRCSLYKLGFSFDHGNLQIMSKISTNAASIFGRDEMARAIFTNWYNEFKDYHRPNTWQCAMTSGLDTAGLAGASLPSSSKGGKFTKRALEGEAQAQIEAQARLVMENGHYGTRYEYTVDVGLPSKKISGKEQAWATPNTFWRLMIKHVLFPAASAGTDTCLEWLELTDLLEPDLFPGLLYKQAAVLNSWVDPIRQRMQKGGRAPNLVERTIIADVDRLRSRLFSGWDVTPKLGWRYNGMADSLALTGNPRILTKIYNPVKLFIDFGRWPTNQAGDNIYSCISGISFHLGPNAASSLRLLCDTDFMLGKGMQTYSKSMSPSRHELKALLVRFLRMVFSPEILISLKRQHTSHAHKGVLSKANQQLLDFPYSEVLPVTDLRSVLAWIEDSGSKGPSTSLVPFHGPFSGAAMLYQAYYPSSPFRPEEVDIPSHVRQSLLNDFGRVSLEQGYHLPWDRPQESRADKETSKLWFLSRAYFVSLLAVQGLSPGADSATRFIYSEDLARSLIMAANPDITEELVAIKLSRSPQWVPPQSSTVIWPASLAAMLDTLVAIPGITKPRSPEATSISDFVVILGSAISEVLKFVPDTTRAKRGELRHERYLVVRDVALQARITVPNEREIQEITSRNQDDDSQDEEAEQVELEILEASAEAADRELILERWGCYLPLKPEDCEDVMKPYQELVREQLRSVLEKVESTGADLARNKNSPDYSEYQANSLNALNEMKAWSTYSRILKRFDSENPAHKYYYVLSCIWTFRAQNPPWFQLNKVKDYMKAEDPNERKAKPGGGRGLPPLLRSIFVCMCLALNDPASRKDLVDIRRDPRKVFFAKQHHRGLNWKMFARFGVGDLRGGTLKDSNWPHEPDNWVPTPDDVLEQKYKEVCSLWKKGKWKKILGIMYSQREIPELGALPHPLVLKKVPERKRGRK